MEYVSSLQGVRKPASVFNEAIRQMNIDELSKLVLYNRYISLLRDYERRCIFYAFIYHLCRILVTVGSLIVPALLSIQYTNTGAAPTQANSSTNFQFEIYWATWIISLLVTTSNGIATAFKIEKKYYFLHTTLEQLRSEGWQFIMLTGRYSGFYTHPEKPTHANQYVFFCHTVEKIKMKQVTEEYFKIEDQKDTQTNIQKQTTSVASIASHEGDRAVNINVTDRASPSKQSLATFISDGLMPPTPLQASLVQLLQTLKVDGERSDKSKSQGKSEMPVRSEVSSETPPREPILSNSSNEVSKEKSINRLGAEIPTKSLEQQQETEKNT